MLNKKPHSLILVLLLIIFGLVANGCGTGSNRQAGTPADKANKKAPISQKNPGSEKKAGNDKAPAFTLTKLNSGQKVSFPADFKDKKVMLNFFSPG